MEQPPLAEYADVRGRVRGVVLLSIVTLLWGTTFLTTRLLVAGESASLPPSLLILYRFLVAALVFSPFLLRDKQPRSPRIAGPLAGRAATRGIPIHSKRLWLAGLELGFWLWCGFASQTLGLAYTTVGRSAFITSLHVVLVPALVAMTGKRVAGEIWVAAALALSGTAVLSYDRAPPNLGDLWTLVTAITYAVYILRLEPLAHRFPALPLTAVQLWVVAALSAGWVAAEGRRVAVMDWKPVAAVLYLALATTALTTWLQAIGQRTVPAAQAALLYTLEPVWAVAFAWLVVREGLGVQGWIGAAAILAGAVVSQWPALRRSAPQFSVIREREDAKTRRECEELEPG
jgi:drug/metabolite transporter (DMT)-like permease